MLQLPEEIILSIFQYLSHLELYNLSLVNKRCRNLAQDEQLWRELLLNLLHRRIAAYVDAPDPHIAGNVSWLKIYRHWTDFPHLLLSQDHDPAENDFFIESTRNETVCKYISLPQRKEATSIHLEAIFNDTSDFPEKKQKTLSLMRNLLQNTLPKPDGYHYQFRETGVVYYEIVAFPNEKEMPDAFAAEAIGIGLVIDSQKNHRLNLFPGWDAGAIGYHSDDGKLFLSTGIGYHTEDRWGTEDIVGCGYDIEAREIFFTRNGDLIASVPDHYVLGFDGAEPLSAMISVDYSASIALNFGQIPFLYCPYTSRDSSKNIDNQVRESRRRATLTIDNYWNEYPGSSDDSDFSDDLMDMLLD
uniref:F-box domain-containing protein n=1 Tax=Vannella robusta TaxID=1487602 RepID=A0A7S4IWD1_9EUKA